MSKVAVVYWSGTGNTEAMASAVVDGVREGGAEAELFTASEFDASMLSSFDAVAFGCPSMGSEQLEDSEFEPMFNSCEGDLGGKKIALFGSYGWGDGQWMRDWEERMKNAGAVLVGGEGVIAHETPDDDALEACREFGKQLANA